MVQKIFLPEIKENAGDRRIRFVISTGDVDRDRDIINPEGWDLKDYVKNLVVQFAHEYHQPPVAKSVEIGVVISGQATIKNWSFWRAGNEKPILKTQ